MLNIMSDEEFLDEEGDEKEMEEEDEGGMGDDE